MPGRQVIEQKRGGDMFNIYVQKWTCCGVASGAREHGTIIVAQKSVPMFACFSLKSITPNRI